MDGDYAVFALIPMRANFTLRFAQKMFVDSFGTYEEAVKFINDYIPANEFDEHIGFMIEVICVIKKPSYIK